MATKLLACLLLFHLYSGNDAQGILYPRASESREVQSLDGVWRFRLGQTADPDNLGRENWFPDEPDPVTGDDVISIPVPSSFNDITQDVNVRDHVGLVWYSRTFYVSDAWRLANRRVWLRFGSVCYAARVWVNNELVTEHEIGHLPFEQEVTSVVQFGAQNTVTVAVWNGLIWDTIPQGSIYYQDIDNGTKVVQSYDFDFYNYAGIDRSVVLYTTPRSYIYDITINTNISGDLGVVNYDILYFLDDADIDGELFVNVEVLDRDGQDVGFGIGDPTIAIIENVTLWWPYLMDPNPGYLYTLAVTLNLNADEVLDVYYQPFGVRTLSWDEHSFQINGRDLYLHGLSKHEDSDIRGKGFDLPTVIRDYNLLKWLGVNVFRTSHYPYAEEIMDLADQNGILIIDEAPSVDTQGFSDSLAENHRSAIRQLIQRDKNRPSVITWSLANEPTTNSAEAGEYFANIANYTRSLDSSRPLTIVIYETADNDQVAQNADILSLNRYNGWYINNGHLDMITTNTIDEATQWNAKYGKPLMLMEYGADTIEGLHIYPEFVWSEEYQVALMSRYFDAFDTLRAGDFFIGEFIWNFADFKTAQSYIRVGGNKKGIFSRNRQPKPAAFHLRRRYLSLAEELYGVPLPDDLKPYVAKNRTQNVKTEL